MAKAADFTSILGTWTNDDAATSNIVKIIVSESDGVLEVQAYGACVPTPCDWGQVTAQGYAATVNGGAVVAFSARYAFDFKSTALTGYLRGPELIVTDCNLFHDDSGRAAYCTIEQFSRQPLLATQPLP